MRALRFDGTVQFRSDIPVPTPAEDEVLVRVRTVGVCNTDIEITRGYKGFTGTLGHEFVGEVVAARERDWIGRRVCGEINVSCGACAECTANRRTHCRNREVLGILRRDGAFADYLVLPVRNLHPVPDAVPDDAAVFVEPIAAAYEVVEQVSVDASTRVVVLGDGKLGLLCAQVVKSAGADVTLLGRHDDHLNMARAMGIAAHRSWDRSETEIDLVIEATGTPTGLQEAVELVRPRGTVVLKSTTSAPVEADLSAVVVKEITVVGSRCGPFQRALDALEAGTVQVAPLIAARYDLDDAVEALRHAVRPGVLKVLVDVDPE